MTSQRVLLRFSKEGEARFLSHHDLMRLFERALRRAELPVRMSQGFNPHPKLSILLALPLGVEAAEEPLEIDFEPPVPPGDVLARLGRQMPAGIRLLAAEALPEGVRARVDAVAYQVELPPQTPIEPADVERFLGRGAIVVERAGRGGARPMDLRPALLAMALEGRRLSFELRVGTDGTPRPAEVVEALLGGRAAGLRLHRTRVRLLIPCRDEARVPDRSKGTTDET